MAGPQTETDDAPALGFNPTIGGAVVKVTDRWVVAVVPMIYNNRIVLSSRDRWREGWIAGWCYDKGLAAALAAHAWDPETEHSPAGFKKVAADDRPASPGGVR